MWKVNLLALLFTVTLRADEIGEAEVLFKHKKEAQAKEKIAAYLSKNDSVLAYEKTGALYSRLQNWAEAVHYFQIAHNRQQNNSAIKYKLGIAYHQNKQLEKSVDMLRAAIQLDQKFLKAVFALADIMESAGDSYEARQVYQQALKKSGENQEIRSKLCVFDFKEAYWREAIDNCTKAVAKNNKDTTAWAILGTSYFEYQQREKAFLELKKGLAINKDSSVLHKARGILYYKEKSYEQAAFDLGRAAALDSLDEETVLYLARSLFEIGRFGDARVAYAEASRLDRAIRFEFQSRQKELLRKNQTGFASDYQDSIDKI